jgi:1-deoxy-D-xylulose 5-phosphate reductoisomerase
VHAFLSGDLPFNGIPRVIEDTLAAVETQPLRDFANLAEADSEARRHAAGAAV